MDLAGVSFLLGVVLAVGFGFGFVFGYVVRGDVNDGPRV